MNVLAALRTISDGAGNPLVAVTDFTPGAGGKVSITAPALAVNNGAHIETSTVWDGNAGAIALNVGSLTLGDGAIIGSRSGAVRPDRGPTVGLGSAGTVDVVATDTISISGRSTSGDGSVVTTSTFGDGNAGDIFLRANRIDIQNGGSVRSESGGMLGDQLLAGGGRGGNVNITAPQVNLLDGGSVSANSQGTANALAGNVNIVTDNLTMKGDSSITTRSLLADGGNISITTNGSLVYLLASQITTSVQSGVGSGGNITIGSADHPIEFIVLNNGQIRADAFGGPGGNISIFADTFLTSESAVSASSALAAPGVINIQARFTNLSGNITQLPENVVQAAELLRAACAARLSAGKSSSLVVAGREGVPLEPGGVMPSPLIADTSADLAPSRAGGDGRDLEPVPAAWRVSLRSKCSI
jgi:large exoprotein involved in heme utilization and adhesion